MTPDDVAKILGLAAAYDNRSVGEANILAWYQALHDQDPADCLAAVALHHTRTDKWIMPVHVRTLAAEIARDRHRQEREARERHALEAARQERGPVTDRSADVTNLINQIRTQIPKGDPTALRRREWVRHDRIKHRAPATPNPHYTGPPPPGGWPIPGEEVPVDHPTAGPPAETQIDQGT